MSFGFFLRKQAAKVFKIKKERKEKLPGSYPNKYRWKRSHLSAYVEIMKRCAAMTHFKINLKEIVSYNFTETSGKESLFSN